MCKRHANDIAHGVSHVPTSDNSDGAFMQASLTLLTVTECVGIEGGVSFFLHPHSEKLRVFITFGTFFLHYNRLSHRILL